MLFLEQQKKQGILSIIHFIGIGGIGMSGIAEIMNNLGYIVQGSDLNTNNNTKRLEAKNIKIFKGHNKSNIENTSYVVVSTAIKEDNPELIEALEKNIPVIQRAEMLAELMRLKCGIAVSGSHGKTTTTSLIACLFEAAGLHPTVINGGIINNRSTNAYLGNGSDYLIAEADESDATFIKIPSTIGVITNIDYEHMDFYKTFDVLKQAFKTFIEKLPFYGFAVACVDHDIVRDIISTITNRKIVTYGIESDDANITAYNIKSEIDNSVFDVKIKMPNTEGYTIIENISIPTPGKHNILNSLAAIAIGAELNFGIKSIKNGFKRFQGIKRRFSLVGNYNGIEIIDDYAHHPVEIEATLKTAKIITNKRGSKLYAIFQPHRYTRLNLLFNDFVKSFNLADQTFILDVFSAGEQPITNITGEELATTIAKNGRQASYIEDIEDITKIIVSKGKEGDIFLLMGAGSISGFTNMLPAKCKAFDK